MQETTELTNEQQGGTMPPAEAIAEAPAPEQTDAAPDAADDPAEILVTDIAEAATATVEAPVEAEEAPVEVAEAPEVA